MSDRDLDTIEEELFDAREELVAHATVRDYENLFSDQQSIGDMREQILSIGDGDAEVRNLLLAKFQVVESLYDEYSVAIVSEVASE